MTPQQIKNKIENLDFWLTNNPNHPELSNVLKDKKLLETELAHEEAKKMNVNNPEILK